MVIERGYLDRPEPKPGEEKRVYIQYQAREEDSSSGVSSHLIQRQQRIKETTVHYIIDECDMGRDDAETSGFEPDRTVYLTVRGSDTTAQEYEILHKDDESVEQPLHVDVIRALELTIDLARAA